MEIGWAEQDGQSDVCCSVMYSDVLGVLVVVYTMHCDGARSHALFYGNTCASVVPTPPRPFHSLPATHLTSCVSPL